MCRSASSFTIKSLSTIKKLQKGFFYVVERFSENRGKAFSRCFSVTLLFETLFLNISMRVCFL